jgi:hypothetical protein
MDPQRGRLEPGRGSGGLPVLSALAGAVLSGLAALLLVIWAIAAMHSFQITIVLSVNHFGEGPGEMAVFVGLILLGAYVTIQNGRAVRRVQYDRRLGRVPWVGAAILLVGVGLTITVPTTEIGASLVVTGLAVIVIGVLTGK